MHKIVNGKLEKSPYNPHEYSNVYRIELMLQGRHYHVLYQEIDDVKEFLQNLEESIRVKLLCALDETLFCFNESSLVSLEMDRLTIKTLQQLIDRSDE